MTSWTARLYDASPDEGGRPVNEPVSCEITVTASVDPAGGRVNIPYTFHVVAKTQIETSADVDIEDGFLVIEREEQPWYSYELGSKYHAGEPVKLGPGTIMMGR